MEVIELINIILQNIQINENVDIDHTIF